MAMHLQIVTYRMGNISESDFIEANKEFAQMMAAVPGLGAKAVAAWSERGWLWGSVSLARP